MWLKNTWLKRIASFAIVIILLKVCAGSDNYDWIAAAGSTCACNVACSSMPALIGDVVSTAGFCSNEVLGIQGQPIAEQAVAASTSSATINWNLGLTTALTLTHSVSTLTLANPVGGQVYRLVVIQGTGGNFTITWPSSVQWQGGSNTPPTLSTSAGQADVFSCLYRSSTSHYLCTIGGQTFTP